MAAPRAPQCRQARPVSAKRVRAPHGCARTSLHDSDLNLLTQTFVTTHLAEFGTLEEWLPQAYAAAQAKP